MCAQKLQFRKVLGPGVLLCGAAVGVSHLVQATRAGADYNFALLGFLLLACVIKWPFLEFGPRYVAATGENLIEGYKKLGTWALIVYLLVTLGTMFIITATVTLVTSILASHLFGIAFTPFIWSAIIILGCAVLLLIGRYPLLDTTMKLIVSVLSISTLIAVIIAMTRLGISDKPITAPGIETYAGLAFLLAMMGWMPIPIDSAVWHTIWTQERAKQTGYRPTLRESLLDYNLGYGAATVLGVLFLSLGALVMFGSGDTFQDGALFASQFVDMYAKTLGQWSFPIISVAALTTMFSTTLVVLDAYPRVLDEFTQTAFNKKISGMYVLVLFILAGLALLIIGVFVNSMKQIVDVATIISFLTAPVFAFMNYRVVTSKFMPEEAKPSLAMRIICWVSMLCLIGFSLAYVYWRFFLEH